MKKTQTIQKTFASVHTYFLYELLFVHDSWSWAIRKQVGRTLGCLVSKNGGAAYYEVAFTPDYCLIVFLFGRKISRLVHWHTLGVSVRRHLHNIYRRSIQYQHFITVKGTAVGLLIQERFQERRRFLGNMETVFCLLTSWGEKRGWWGIFINITINITVNVTINGWSTMCHSVMNSSIKYIIIGKLLCTTIFCQLFSFKSHPQVIYSLLILVQAAWFKTDVNRVFCLFVCLSKLNPVGIMH